jgi:hypothetical protein
MRRLATLGVVIVAAALTAAGQLTITTNPALPTAIIGQPYSLVGLQATGAPGPLTWSFSDGGPLNFLVNQFGTFCYGPTSCSTNVVQTPPGVYNFGIQVTSQSTDQSGFQEFTLVVENPLQILTKFLANAIANQTYSTSLQGSGGTDKFTWSILTGPLPPGISLTDSANGVLSGTAPGVNATYPILVQLLDQVTQETATQGLSIAIVNGVAIITPSLPNATINQPYAFQLLGTPQINVVWSVTQGSQLPPGFSLSPDGVLTGTGVTLGAFSFQIQLVNAQFPTQAAVRTFSFQVALGPLSIAQGALPPATLNVPYSVTLHASGGIPPYTWSLGIGVPQGISIDPNTGIISGTPTQAGSFPLAVTLQDSSKVSVTQNYTLVVGNTLAITNTTLPNGSPNVAYSVTLTAAAGQPPYTWSITTGSLPPGLSLNPANGQISGTTTALGSYPITAKVTDAAGGTATKNLTILISQQLTITTTSLPGASLNQPYNQTLTSAGGVPPITWSIISGNLPMNLSLNPLTGAITGTPTVLQPSAFTVQAFDSSGQTASKAFALTVASLVTISASSFTTTLGVAVSQTATASGGIPPYAFTGNLPGGLQIGTTGVISGTPTTTGAFNVTLQATDAEGRTATASITITVSSPPVTIVVPTTGTGSGQQPGIGVSISAPATGDINGTLTLAFVSSVGGDDQTVRFAPSGSRSVTFRIPQGSTTAPNATVITGTVAGTITLTASVPGNPDVVNTIVIAPAVPVISSVALQQVTGGLNVVVTGYSNTREVSTGSFTFTVSSGNKLSQATITVPLTSAYATWFGNTSSNATGGQFTLTVPFSVTQGSAMAVTEVSVTLTNVQGASAAVSSPPQ